MQEEVAKEFGIPIQFQRFWLWAKRQNHTYRPNRPLTHLEEQQSVNVFYFSTSSMLWFQISYVLKVTLMLWNYVALYLIGLSLILLSLIFLFHFCFLFFIFVVFGGLFSE